MKPYKTLTLVDELPLSLRTYNCLKSSQIITIKDLRNKSDNDLLRIKNLGLKSLREIKEVLNQLDMDISMYAPSIPVDTRTNIMDTERIESMMKTLEDIISNNKRICREEIKDFQQKIISKLNNATDAFIQTSFNNQTSVDRLISKLTGCPTQHDLSEIRIQLSQIEKLQYFTKDHQIVITWLGRNYEHINQYISDAYSIIKPLREEISQKAINSERMINELYQSKQDLEEKIKLIESRINFISSK